MKSEITKPILAGVLLTFIAICIVMGMAFYSSQGNPLLSAKRTAVFTVIRMPTLTETPPARGIATITVSPVDYSGIHIGSIVQIKGTGGVGLKIRVEPGMSGETQFIAMEDEIFEVLEGPKITDGITWWKLSASYDKNRQGWAAGQYLAVIQ